jgi:hypothetical protein
MWPRFAAAASAISAQLLAAIDTHWSGPCGNPLSKYAWNATARDVTYHDPSTSCERSR